jgi:hypothetical protein
MLKSQKKRPKCPKIKEREWESPLSAKECPSQKICSGCKRILDKDSFYKKGSSFHSRCKPCFLAKSVEYREKNTENVKRSKKIYYQNNKSKILESLRVWRELNPTYFLEYRQRKEVSGGYKKIRRVD